MASGSLSQHLYHVGTTGDSGYKQHPLAIGSCLSTLSTPGPPHAAGPVVLSLQVPPQWQKLQSVCQTSPHYVKGELKQFRKPLHKSWQLSQLFFLFILCSLFLLWLWVTGLLIQPLGREAPNGTWFTGNRVGWEGSKYIASYLQNILPHTTIPLPGLSQIMEPTSFKAFFFASFLVVFIQHLLLSTCDMQALCWEPRQ